MLGPEADAWTCNMKGTKKWGLRNSTCFFLGYFDVFE
jgi:hypothetical protein